MVLEKVMKEVSDDMKSFRVKIDLSQFYNDERKLSYIYIDKVKVNNVLHLQTKIQNVFGIIEPLHLVINGIFLPVVEDIRIINEDDVVVVKSSISNSNNLSNGCNKDIKKSENNDPMEESISQCERYELANKDSKVSDHVEANVYDNDIEIDDSHADKSEIPHKKRKRIRRRKKQNTNEMSPIISPNIQKSDLNPTSYQITKFDVNTSSPKHLKFHWNESDDRKKDVIVNNTRSSSSKPIVRSTENINLEALLNLRNNNVPLTFSSQKKTRMSPNISSFNNNSSPPKMNTSTIPTNISSTESIVDYSKINIEEYPFHNEKFETNDTIAFQILTLNEYYCPVISDYIVAKIISKDVLNDNYSCKILVGYDQLKTPDGKFALPADSDEEKSNMEQHDSQKLFTLAHCELKQPRLIYRSYSPC